MDAIIEERREDHMEITMKDKVVIITGHVQGIGAALAHAFEQEGAHVCGIDIQPNDYVQGDIKDPQVLEAFVHRVIADYGHVDILINNAMMSGGGLHTASYDQFIDTLRVGVAAPFYLVKLLEPYFADGASIINISSTRDRMSQADTESYTAAKGGIAALTHALVMSLSPRVRVNSVSPGWIDTTNQSLSHADHAQQPGGRVGHPADIAQLVLFLASDQASFINGENITIDGGMTKRMIYHNDEGWIYNPLTK